MDGCMWKNAALNSGSSLLYYFIQWLTTVLAVRFADFSVAGVYALAISFTNIFYFVALFGIRSYQIGDVDRRFSPGQYLAVRLALAGGVMAVFLAVLAVVKLDGYARVCYLLYMVFKMGEAYTEGYFALLQTQGRYGVIAASCCAKAIVPGGGFALALYLTHDLRWAIGAMAALYAATAAAVDMPRWKSLPQEKPCLRGSGGILVHSAPLLLVSLSVPVMNYATRHAVEATLDRYWVGQYASLSSVIVVMSTLAGAVFVVLIPEASRMTRQGDRAKLGRLTAAAAAGMAVCSALAIAAGKLVGAPVCAFLFGGAILESIGLLAPLLVTACLLMVKSFLAAMLTAMEKRRLLLAGEYAGLALCVLTARPLTERFGMQGANGSYLLGVAVQVLVLGVVYGVTLARLKTPEETPS